MLLAVVIEEERRSKEALRESANLMGLAAEAGNLAMWVWDVSGNDVWMTERGRSLFGLGRTRGSILRQRSIACTLRIAPPVKPRSGGRSRREADTEWSIACSTRMARPAGFMGGVVVWARRRHRPEAVRRVDGCHGSQRGRGVRRATAGRTGARRTRGHARRAHRHPDARTRAATRRDPTNASVGVRLLDAPEPDLQEVRSTLADIREVTERAGEVIGGLRAMLKRDSTAAGLTNVDVNNVIRIVERIVHGDATLHKVTVHLDLSSDVRPVKGDSVQLQQVVLNLMLNAFSAMSGTGLDGARRLVVRTNSIDGSNVLIEVQDSGTGIAAEKLESIFDPFVTSKPEGLGMGLSICRSIIERHGGKISAANNPDRGAKFSIMLPVTRE